MQPDPASRGGTSLENALRLRDDCFRLICSRNSWMLFFGPKENKDS
jgi:hypothetical protein